MPEPVRDVICTPEQQALVLEGIREGMSLTGAARLAGRSRSWLTIARNKNPAFAEAVQIALGQLEREMCVQIRDAVRGEKPDPALINVLEKLLAHRFPQLHGSDPRLRYSIETAGEEHEDDSATAKTQIDGPGALLGRLVDKMLSEDEAGGSDG